LSTAESIPDVEVKEDLVLDNINQQADSPRRVVSVIPEGALELGEATEELGDGNVVWRGFFSSAVKMETLYNMRMGFESDSLSSLLSILDAKKVRSLSKRAFTLLKTS
jgi:hypothetical protein